MKKEKGIIISKFARNYVSHDKNLLLTELKRRLEILS